MRILRDVLLGLGLGIAALGSAQAAESPTSW